MITKKGIYYFPTFQSARAFANVHALPTDRIISYTSGWAIQRETSGPYWGPQGWDVGRTGAKKMAFQRHDDVVPADLPDREVTRTNVGVVTSVDRTGVHVEWENGQKRCHAASDLRRYHGPITGRAPSPERSPTRRSSHSEHRRLHDRRGLHVVLDGYVYVYKTGDDEWETVMVSRKKAERIGSVTVDGHRMVKLRGSDGNLYAVLPQNL